MSLRRRFFWADDLGNLSQDSSFLASERRWPVTSPDDANLVSSMLEHESGDDIWTPRRHAPTLDIDHKVTLTESETPGHYHLLIDVPMPWEDYVLLLETLAKVGVIEEGYARASISRGASYVATKPWKQAA